MVSFSSASEWENNSAISGFYPIQESLLYLKLQISCLINKISWKKMPQNRKCMWFNGWLSDQLDQLADVAWGAKVTNLTPRACLEELCSTGIKHWHLWMQGAFRYICCPISSHQLNNEVGLVTSIYRWGNWGSGDEALAQGSELASGTPGIQSISVWIHTLCSQQHKDAVIPGQLSWQ